MRIADELATASRELQRLIGMEDVQDDLIVHVFADEELVRNINSSPRSASELRDFFAGAPRRAPRSPEAIQRAVVAFWRWAGSGFGVVDASTRARRLEACRRCEDYRDVPRGILYSAAATAARETKICQRCGCFVEKKTRLASEACPRNRWPPLEPPSSS